MADFIAIVIIVMILGLAIRYIYKEKKKGVHCIGCPSAGACHKAACSCKDK
ncbi:MAG: FeoB-associated Cys-rich membrane protein [Butyrivibrio sp.]|nr:FeoB-associated Cys-rich membrane protein [Butyrivibrio sp.]